MNLETIVILYCCINFRNINGEYLLKIYVDVILRGHLWCQVRSCAVRLTAATVIIHNLVGVRLVMVLAGIYIATQGHRVMLVFKNILKQK